MRLRSTSPYTRARTGSPEGTTWGAPRCRLMRYSSRGSVTTPFPGLRAASVTARPTRSEVEASRAAPRASRIRTRASRSASAALSRAACRSAIAPLLHYAGDAGPGHAVPQRRDLALAGDRGEPRPHPGYVALGAALPVRAVRFG